MEEFTSEIQKELKPTAFSELDSNMELLNTFSEINQPLNSHVLDYFSSESFLNNNDANISQPSYTSNIPLQLFNHPENLSTHHDYISVYDQTDATVATSPGLKGSDTGHKFNINGVKKRKRKGEEVNEKPKEVIHVRAKRGQATDSHSLAERVRREKINEKLKLLQDLVPGCYKTMGMAVMLDVIINYVRSLQNQIEFLSMKLSAASMYYDFNSPEAEAIETLQRTTNSYDAQDMGKMAREGFGWTIPHPHSSNFF